LLNVHFHSLMPDGIFELEEEGVPLPPPEDGDVEAILRRVIRRTAKALAVYDEEAFLAQVRERSSHGRGLPAFVERELRAYST
jgi:hypothetical protein